jgi:regulator of protease activity HflC (stomatin/prohibitin superfamily)
MNIGGFEAFVLVFLVLAAVALWSTVKMVPQGYNYTVENSGATPARSIRGCIISCR